MLVNPLVDGMNLVAKEAAVVSERDAVLVLSETAGAFDQMADGALAVAPADVAGTADALARGAGHGAGRSAATALARSGAASSARTSRGGFAPAQRPGRGCAG